MKKKLTKAQIEQIDNNLLDLAEKMISLLKKKGFEDNSDQPLECECIQVWIHNETIEVGVSCQRELTTIQRKKK